ncbi:unnamed protein product, partial [Ectocarpus sp. 8 AP-2014]
MDTHNSPFPWCTSSRVYVCCARTQIETDRHYPADSTRTPCRIKESQPPPSKTELLDDGWMDYSQHGMHGTKT